MRPIQTLVVHCTATPENRPHTVEDIRRWHKQQGWSDIGYHYVVYLDGTVHAGRPVNQIGAHVAGKNVGSIGVTYVGGCDANMKPKDTRTAAQKMALRQLLSDLVNKYDIKTLVGHRDFDSKKACPSFDAKREYADLLKGGK